MVQILWRSSLEEDTKEDDFFNCQEVEFEKCMMQICMKPQKTHNIEVARFMIKRKH